MTRGRFWMLGLAMASALALVGAEAATADCSHDGRGRSSHRTRSEVHRHTARSIDNCRLGFRGHRPKRRYEGGRYIALPGYWYSNGYEEIWFPPRKIWKPGYYYYE